MLDEQNAYRITERLSFPRISGSEGEKKAVGIIMEEFENAGYSQIKREKFKTSLYNWKLAEYFFLVSSLMILVLAIVFYFLSIITLVLAVIMLVSMIKFLGLVNTPKIRLFHDQAKNLDTENLYTELKREDCKLNIIILAHHDTKSQTLPSHIRMNLIIFMVFGGFVLLIVYIIFSLIKIFLNSDFMLVNNILLICALIISILAMTNYFNKTGNESPGAIDNAASVGTIIELARYYKLNPQNNINFTFLITGSEELNQGGAYDFITKHEDEFDRTNSFFIDFDLVGGKGAIFIVSADGIPKKVNESRLIEYYIEAGQKLNIQVDSKYIPTGAWGDHTPIINQGFEACFVGSSGSQKRVHTKKDTMDLVSTQGLKNILLVTAKVIEMINKDFQ